MANIDTRLLDDVKLSMKSGEKSKTETLRTLRAQLKDAKIKKGEELDESEEIQILTTAAKRRKESIELFRKGNREDLVEKEQFRLKLIEQYLPEQLTGEEISKIVEKTISSLGVNDIKDLGRVMGAMMPQVKGKADGKLVQSKVREALSNLA